jgi:hypothetical protein
MPRRGGKVEKERPHLPGQSTLRRLASALEEDEIRLVAHIQIDRDEIALEQIAGRLGPRFP